MSMIPKLPGVPALIAYALPMSTRLNLTNLISLFIGPPAWGIYDSGGRKVLDADSVIDMGFSGSSDVSDYPVEKGSFASYNKVQHPDSFTVRLSMGRSTSDREAFLSAIDAIKKSLKLYSVVTPEKTYRSVNIHGYDYRREQTAGANMITVELSCREIREKTVQYSKTGLAAVTSSVVKNPASAPAMVAGKVQAKVTAVTSQFNSLKSRIPVGATGTW
ncbi:MAG: hypothetical protein HGA87_00285 [Desulfobulbaceae bacterium]|nr:hypothetical protein [Desulfobulbaceae bacterium]